MSESSRLWAFRAISLVAGLIVAVIVGEALLLVHARIVAGSEKMDDGLVRYDPDLGWRLTPGWRGTHEHFDYTTNYTIDLRGFRTDPNTPAPAGRGVALVVGDSFTFGLGVGDGETFTSRLNADAGSERWVNAGVPGYAPEQTWLWLQQARVLARPDVIFFVVYLGNDLVDIGLDYAVQSPWAKPAARLAENGELVIGGRPVPQVPKPPALAARTLASYVLGDSREPGLFEGLRLYRLLALAVPEDVDREALRARLAPKVALFEALLDAMVEATSEELVLVLMPGASLVGDPGSVSGQYQQLVREEVTSLAGSKGVTLLDPTDALARDHYFPNDGHLTPAGHEVFARALGEAMKGM